jgi:hypothetical protein
MVSCPDERMAEDGTRRVWLSVPAHEDLLGIEVAIAPDDTLRSLSAYLSVSWIREDSPASVSAVVCISSLLRSLEPDDSFVWELSAALLSQVGLGPPRFADLDAAHQITPGEVADALLGRTEGIQVSLAQSSLLSAFVGPGAVVIEWLAAPSDIAAPVFKDLERRPDRIGLVWSGDLDLSHGTGVVRSRTSRGSLHRVPSGRSRTSGQGRGET